ARAQFKRRSTANNVEILVPVPSDADTPRFRTPIGSVHYHPEKSAILWKIKQFGGGKEFLMRAELGLPSVKGDDEVGGGMTGGFGGSMGGVAGAQGAKGKRPISVKFEIPYFTTSGIQVRYLKIIEPKVRFRSIPSFSTPFPVLTSYSLSHRNPFHISINPPLLTPMESQNSPCGVVRLYRWCCVIVQARRICVTHHAPHVAQTRPKGERNLQGQRIARTPIFHQSLRIPIFSFVFDDDNDDEGGNTKERKYLTLPMLTLLSHSHTI
ncbi:MAG: hypothetical protein Q9182_006885, partial [Xanthomendoza sp. 2 TL-2023]